MTVLAAEAGAGAAESEAAAASGAGRKMTRRPSAAAVERERNANIGPGNRYYELRERRSGGRTQQGTSGSRRASTAAPKPRVPTHAQRVAAGNQRQPLPSGVARNRRVAKRAASTGAKKLTGNYHGAVFGEWLAAVLLIAALPFARPNKTGVSPYSGKDMVQLLAITVVYLILAILAVPGKTSARFAAWFGALLLLAIGLAETANIASAVSQWLNPGAQAAATTAAPKPNPSTVNPGSTTPAAATSTGISRNVAQDPGNGLS